MKSSILPESIHRQYFSNHVNSLQRINNRKNQFEESTLSVVKQLTKMKRIKNQVMAFEQNEEQQSIAYSNHKIRQAIQRISQTKHNMPKLNILRKERTEISDSIAKENQRLKKSIESVQNSLTYRTKHQVIKKSYYNKMNNYNNNDSEIVQSTIGPLRVRRSTLSLSLVREFDLPTESFERAIEIMSKNLQLNEQGARIYMQDILREFGYFKALEQQAEYFDYIEQTISSLEYRQIKKGNIVFHCGERGDYFYMILKGTVLVYVPKKDEELQKQRAILIQLNQCKEDLLNTKKKEELKTLQKQIQDLQTQLKEYQSMEDILLFPYKNRYYQKTQNGQMICLYKKVNVMKDGECFGEVSLFRNEPRAATLIALDTLHLGALNKTNYLRIFESKLEKLNFTLGMLSKMFPQSSKEIVIQLSFDFIKRLYSINQIIFKQNDIIDGLYLIFNGIVEISSDGVRVNQYSEGQFVGLFDLKNPGLRQYTAMSVSYETIIYFLPKKQCTGLDKFMRERMNDLRQSSENFRMDWVKKCQKMVSKQKQEQNKIILQDINPREILQKCITQREFKPNKKTLSQERITEIVEYNNHQCSLKEKLKNVKLCLQMRDFDKEKELVEKMMKQQYMPLPKLRERPRNLHETYTALMSRISQNSPIISEHISTRNMHVEKIMSIRQKKSEQILNLMGI